MNYFILGVEQRGQDAAAVGESPPDANFTSVWRQNCSCSIRINVSSSSYMVSFVDLNGTVHYSVRMESRENKIVAKGNNYGNQSLISEAETSRLIYRVTLISIAFLCIVGLIGVTATLVMHSTLILQNLSERSGQGNRPPQLHIQCDPAVQALSPLLSQQPQPLPGFQSFSELARAARSPRNTIRGLDELEFPGDYNHSSIKSFEWVSSSSAPFIPTQNLFLGTSHDSGLSPSFYKHPRKYRL